MKKKNSFLNMRSHRSRFLGLFMLGMFFFLGASQVEAQKKMIPQDVAAMQIQVDQLVPALENAPTGPKKTYYSQLVVFYQAVIEDVQVNGKTYRIALGENKELFPQEDYTTSGNQGGSSQGSLKKVTGPK